MSRSITFVYPYYDNPEMLKIQLDNWKKYPKELRDNLEVIVVDDCSPNSSALEVVQGKNISIDFKLYRILRNVRWNWLAARNIGAKFAKNEWILLTDIDHLITADCLGQLMTKKLKQNILYLFNRVNASDYTLYKPHDDSFFLTKDLFWKSEGYDEDLSGNYGTSGRFRKRLLDVAGNHKRLDLSLIRYSREVLPDASTTEFERKNGDNKKYIKMVEEWKEREGRKKVETFLHPWKRQI